MHVLVRSVAMMTVLILVAGAAQRQSANRPAGFGRPSAHPQDTSTSTPAPERSMILPPIPASMVHLDTVQGYVNSPPASFGVFRTGAPSRGTPSCPTFVDRIDLRPVRRNNYVLIAVEIQAYGPTGRSGTSPFTMSGLDGAGLPMPPGTPSSNYHTMVIRAAAGSLLSNSGQPLQICGSGYRLYLTAKGLRGIDPLTGAKVPL